MSGNPLESLFPHHKHAPPDIKQNRVPAPEMSFYETFGQGKPFITISGAPSDRRIIFSWLGPIFNARPGWQRFYFDLPGTGQTRGENWIDGSDFDRAGHALGVEQGGLFQALVNEWIDRVEEYRARNRLGPSR